MLEVYVANSALCFANSTNSRQGYAALRRKLQFDFLYEVVPACEIVCSQGVGYVRRSGSALRHWDLGAL